MNTLPFIIHIFCSFIEAYLILSLGEYIINLHLMHSHRIARLLRSDYLWDIFYEHAIIHHHRCYDKFDHEEGACGHVNIRVPFKTAALAAIGPFLLLLPIDALTAVILAAGAIVNGAIWSSFHSEMHQPASSRIGKWSIFKYLRRWHFLHHRYPSANFNTLFLMWDWILATRASESEADLTEIRAQTWRVRIRRT
jgi:hypothetical protein